MVDPQTPNLQLYTPANGADPGTWDVPVNANSNQLEAILSGVASVGLSNLPVTLSGAQYNNSLITFTGTLTATVTVTFPMYARTWTLFNNCLGDPRSLTVVCKTSASSVYVALPPGEPIRVVSDGTNMRHIGLDRVGKYLDLGSSAVPAWITQTVPQPYLNCDGTAFSSATYPALRDFLGAATLPDARGRFRAALAQGTGRLSGASGTNGLDGTMLLAGGGNQAIGQTNIPNYTLGGTGTTVNVYVVNGGSQSVAAGADAGVALYGGNNNQVTVSIPSGGSGSAYAPPSYIGGLTLIRAG